MCFPHIVTMWCYKLPPAAIYNTFTVGESQYFDADKVKCTFTNVIVDLVSRGAGDQSLTDITPRSIHAALVQLAGTCGQTLVYVYCLEEKKNVEKRVIMKKENKSCESAP